MTDVDSELQVRSAGARVVIRIIRFYQLVRSGRPPVCRFSPTCSAYAAEAVARHGALRGSWMAARRVSRCRPLGGFGFDPVPGTERRVGDQEHAHV